MPKDAVVELAREYCRRGEYFYMLFVGNSDIEYTPEVVSAYPESERFLDWACALDLEDPVYDEAREVRSLAPFVSIGS